MLLAYSIAFIFILFAKANGHEKISVKRDLKHGVRKTNDL